MQLVFFFVSGNTAKKIIKQWFITCPEILGSFLVSRVHILCASANIQGVLFLELLFEQGIVSTRKVQQTVSVENVSVKSVFYFEKKPKKPKKVL